MEEKCSGKRCFRPTDLIRFSRHRCGGERYRSFCVTGRKEEQFSIDGGMVCTRGHGKMVSVGWINEKSLSICFLSLLKDGLIQSKERERGCNVIRFFQNFLYEAIVGIRCSRICFWNRECWPPRRMFVVSISTIVMAGAKNERVTTSSRTRYKWLKSHSRDRAGSLLTVSRYEFLSVGTPLAEAKFFERTCVWIV